MEIVAKITNLKQSRYKYVEIYIPVCSDAVFYFFIFSNRVSVLTTKKLKFRSRYMAGHAVKQIARYLAN